VALIAIAFLILVIYLTKTLKSLQMTLDNVAITLSGLEKQLDGVTSETTMLLHKTNALASDIQQKAENLNSVVDAVKDVGNSVRNFNGSIQKVTTTVNQQIDENKDKMAQVIQWSNILLDLKDKWQERKQNKLASHSFEKGIEIKKKRARD